MRRKDAGFTLIEVIVAAVMIAVVMIGMGSMLMTYSTSRTKINRLAVAQNIVQSELDDVLVHTQIENSLMSDPVTSGRSRPVYIGNGALTVSNYFYYNFPASPDHNLPGMIWTGAGLSADQNRFYSNAYYDAGGNRLYGILGVTDPRVVYIGRLQLFGVVSPATTQTGNSGVETYINGSPDPLNYPNGQWLDTTATPSYLIADTCENSSSTSSVGTFYMDVNNNSFNNANSRPVNTNFYREKIFVVRLYDVLAYKQNGTSCFLKRTTGGTLRGEIPEITHGYIVINGKVRL